MLRRLMDSPLIIFHSCRKTKGLLNSSVKVAFNSLKMATLIAASWFWRIIFAKCILSSVMKYKMLVIECHENQMMQKEVLQKTTIPKNILAFWFINASLYLWILEDRQVPKLAWIVHFALKARPGAELFYLWKWF